jgi:hypothetical protein
MPQPTYPEAAIACLVQGVTRPFPVSSPGRTVLIPARACGRTSSGRTEPGPAVSLAAAPHADTRAGNQGGTLGHVLAWAGTAARNLPMAAKERA